MNNIKDIEDIYTNIQKKLQTASFINNAPFKILEIDNFLDHNTYENLSYELQNNDFNEFNNSTIGKWHERRVTRFIEGPYSELSKISFNNKNLENLKNKYPYVHKFINILKNNKYDLFNTLNKKYKINYSHEDCDLWVNITQDRSNYNISPHWDSNNIYTILFYTPINNNNSNAGTNILANSNTIFKKLDFIKNKFIVFSPYSDEEKTWHSVDKINIKESRNSIQIFYMDKKVSSQF